MFEMESQSVFETTLYCVHFIHLQD